MNIFLFILATLNSHIPVVHPSAAVQTIKGAGGGFGGTYDPRYKGPTLAQRIQIDTDNAGSTFMQEQYTAQHYSAVIAQGRRDVAMYKQFPDTYQGDNLARECSLLDYGLACLHEGFVEEGYNALVMCKTLHSPAQNLDEVLVMMSQLDQGQDDLVRQELSKHPEFSDEVKYDLKTFMPDASTPNGLKLLVYYVAYKKATTDEDTWTRTNLLSDHYLEICHQIAPDNPEVGLGYIELLEKNHRFDEAWQLNLHYYNITKGNDIQGVFYADFDGITKAKIAYEKTLAGKK